MAPPAPTSPPGSIPPAQARSRGVGRAAGRGPAAERVREPRPAAHPDTAPAAVRRRAAVGRFEECYLRGGQIILLSEIQEGEAKTSLATFLS